VALRDESLEVLAAWAPALHEALVGLGEGDFVIVDGTLIRTDRVTAVEPYYSQKHRQHSMNVQVIAAQDGTPLWFSRGTPGRTHDLSAVAPTASSKPASHGRPRPRPTAPTRAPAPPSAPPTRTTANNLSTPSSSTATTPRLRAPGERAFAQLKSWRLLRRARCSTRHIGTAVQGVHALLTCDYSR
jgi:hypothetical protein